MPEMTRRTLLRTGALAGAGLFLRWDGQAVALPLRTAPTLGAGAVPKYVSPLVVPPAMPRTSTISGGAVDYYVIGLRQLRQQVLPGGMPATTVWGYGSQSTQGTFHAPSYTIEAAVGRPVRVTWVNGLMDGRRRFLPHLLPVDPTLHWANPPGGVSGRDSMPTFSSVPGPYTGPVPIVTHLHGGHSNEESDGFPEAWYLPRARNIPQGYARVGSQYDRLAEVFAGSYGDRWEPGEATVQYDNDQPAANLWYHDHALGITRLNVYAGPAGFYLLRGGAHDLPDGVLPNGDREIVLAVQDRSFNADGSLFYPDTREFFDDFAGPYVPDSDIAPIWNPEFFGNTMMVNGRTWPDLEVTRRRYRFRILNGCGSRFLILKVVTDPLAARPADPALPMWQVGGDGGFLPAPVEQGRLLVAPAERVDVVVDFSGVPAGTRLYLINEGPDEPFGGGEPGEEFEVADVATTGQVMRFSVVAGGAPDTSTPAEQLVLPAPPSTGTPTRTRQVALLEADSEVLEEVGPRAAFLGVMHNGEPEPRSWDDEVTESPVLGTTEDWEIFNFTEDAHPIHLHLVQFEVLGREGIEDGAARGPEPGETGPKDTVIALPGEVTRVRAHFDKPGLFVWHCHIIEHEDHEMMRPLRVVRG